MDAERIFSAEQIVVPPELPEIIKDFTKEVIRANPADLDEFGAQCVRRPAASPLRPLTRGPRRGAGHCTRYFGALAGVEGYEDQGKDADASDGAMPASVAPPRVRALTRPPPRPDE